MVYTMNLQILRVNLLQLISLCLFFFVTTVHANTVRPFVILTENWPPYNFQKDGIAKGISIDILQLVLKKAGRAQDPKDVKIYPWIRAYKAAQNETNSILLSTARTEERESVFKWVGPIFEIEYNLYALKSMDIKINSLEDLVKYKVGTLRGDAVEEVLINNSNLKKSDLQRVASNIQNTKKLTRGRVDLIAQSRETTLATCKEAKLNPLNFTVVYTISKQDMYYAFHKETPESVIAALQSAFDELKKEGKVAEIFHNYKQSSN